MDATSFDRFSRLFAKRLSRRSLARTAMGAAGLVAFGAGHDLAEAQETCALVCPGES